MHRDRGWKLRVAVAVIASAGGLGILEAGVRILGTSDRDGQFFFGGHPIKPYVLPYHALKDQIDAFEKLSKPYVIPDVRLGWTHNPNASTADRRYASNAIGIRSDREFTVEKPPGTYRVGLFGDSFVHGDDVSFTETWAYQLEQGLRRDRGSVEVMNFGVGGYGNDQAYLRWLYEGRQYAFDVVIIGFQAENCLRNLNVIRKFYFRGSSIPFSKPRFVLKEGRLELVNSPAILYRELPDAVRDFATSPVREYEYYYRARDYETSVMQSSKLVGTVKTLLQLPPEFHGIFEADTEESELCFRLFERFTKEAAGESAVFVVHLPTKTAVSDVGRGRSLPYTRLLERLANSFRLIDPASEILQASAGNLDGMFQGHYSGKGNAAVAAAIGRTLSKTGSRPERAASAGRP